MKFKSALIVVFSLSMGGISLVSSAIADEHSKFESLILPVATKLKIVLQDGVESDSAREGQFVKALTIEDVYENEKLLVPKGTEIIGNVVLLHPLTEKKKGYYLEFIQIKLPNQIIKISAIPVVRGSQVMVERENHQVGIGAREDWLSPDSKQNPRSLTLMCGSSRIGPSLKSGDKFTLSIAQDVRTFK